MNKNLFLHEFFDAKKLVKLHDQKLLLIFGRELCDLTFANLQIFRLGFFDVNHEGLFEVDLCTEFP